MSEFEITKSACSKIRNMLKKVESRPRPRPRLLRGVVHGEGEALGVPFGLK